MSEQKIIKKSSAFTLLKNLLVLMFAILAPWGIVIWSFADPSSFSHAWHKIVHHLHPDWVDPY